MLLKKVLFFYILRALTTITYDDDNGDDDALNEWATLFLLGNITRTSAYIVKGLMAAAISPFVGPILFLWWSEWTNLRYTPAPGCSKVD